MENNSVLETPAQKPKKSIFSIAINSHVLGEFNNIVKTNSINKSALVEKLIIEWMQNI